MKSIFFILFACIGIAGNAQKISHVRTALLEKKFTINYDISGIEGQNCLVRLFISTDEGKSFEREITDASGDVGENIKVGNRKKINWDSSNENLDVEKIKFSIQIQAIGMPPKKKKK
jgi:hypothetical protein